MRIHPLHLSFYFASFKKFIKEDGRMEMRIDKQGERHKLERRKKKSGLRTVVSVK